MTQPVRDTAFDRWFLRLWLAGFIGVALVASVAYMTHQVTTCRELRLSEAPDDYTCEFVD